MPTSHPDNPLGQAIQLFQAGRLSEARLRCSIVLRQQPKNFEALYLVGVIDAQEGRLDDAVAHLKRALNVKPRSPEVLLNLGIVQLKSCDHRAAIGTLRKAIAIQPGQALAHDVLGLALAGTTQYDAAHASLRKAIAIKPNYAEAHMHLGSLEMTTGRLAEAISSLRTAITLNPNLAEAHHHLGTSLLAVRRPGEAVESLRKALAINPSLVDAQRNLGLALRDLGRPDQAIKCFNAALALSPGHIPSLNALGNTLKQLGSYDAALAAYQAVSERDPDDANAVSMSAFLRRTMCDWKGIEQIESRLIEHVRSGRVPVMPFPFLAVTDDRADQLHCARQHWNSRQVATTRFPEATGRGANDRIRLGYLSADFHSHATAYLMAQLFEEHDRSQFDVFAFSHGPDDDSPMRRRLVAAFDRFIDVQQDSDEDAARRIAELGIDILVDLKGHTEFARLEILARRPAPVQVHYIGYPGTLGTDFVDYLIVDPVVVRPDEAADFTEQLVFLPQCYQVNDRMRPGGTGNASRESCGLPRGGFVFCNFNNSYKITPDLFDIWMRLVKMVPDSVFWLLSDNQWADENLRREAQAHGVTADRLIFAPRLGLEEHLARQPLADLFLDTAPYSAHTTASDALWMGLPVLTIAGRSFASRVAASLLHAVHLPELVTHDRVEYERVALDLASDRQKLSALRRRLRENLLTAPLFDIARTRRDLEAAYCQMWEIYVRGEAPSSFRVAKI